LDFLDKSWVRLKIAFDVRDDLRKTDRPFQLPEDVQSMSADRKQVMTVCNLFANHGQSIEELAVYYHMDRSRVIAVLMQEGLLKEQRRRHCGPIRGGRRESDRAGWHTVTHEPWQAEINLSDLG
jgi:sugar-specific transcriptional regulator TrmB